MRVHQRTPSNRSERVRKKWLGEKLKLTHIAGYIIDQLSLSAETFNIDDIKSDFCWGSQPFPLMDQIASTPLPVRLNGGPHHPDAAQFKRETREAILAQYPDWRPDLSKGIPDDVSSWSISRLSPREVKIVRFDATGLLERIHKGVYSAVEVATAYSKAAIAAQDLTNCLSEIFIEEGLKRARELDEIFQQTGRVVGPLHGLPVSIKDHMKIKGLDASSGYVAWAGKTISDRDAVIVYALRRAGAILYVKTANPQSLLVSSPLLLSIRL